MLTRFPLGRLLLLFCTFLGFVVVPACWGETKPTSTRGDLQLLLTAPALGAVSANPDEAGATTPAGIYGLEYADLDLRPDDHGQRLPSDQSTNAASLRLLLKRYGEKIGIPSHLAAGFDGLSHVKWTMESMDNALVGGAIGIASSYVFADSYKGWRVKVEGGIRDVSVNLKLAW